MANPHFHFLFTARKNLTIKTINFVYVIHLSELEIQFFCAKKRHFCVGNYERFVRFMRGFVKKRKKYSGTDLLAHKKEKVYPEKNNIKDTRRK